RQNQFICCRCVVLRRIALPDAAVGGVFCNALHGGKVTHGDCSGLFVVAVTAQGADNHIIGWSPNAPQPVTTFGVVVGVFAREGGNWVRGVKVLWIEQRLYECCCLLGAAHTGKHRPEASYGAMVNIVKLLIGCGSI